MRGFTLIEVLIVLGLMVSISVGIVLNLSSYQSARNLDIDARQIVAVLRDAQSRAINREDDVAWEVRFDGVSAVNSYALYKATLPVSLVSSTFLHSGIIFSPPGVNPSNMQFEKGTGRLSAMGNGIITIALQSDSTAQRTITIFLNGTIQVE